jgi:glucose/arabinose dehydrogenase
MNTNGRIRGRLTRARARKARAVTLLALVAALLVPSTSVQAAPATDFVLETYATGFTLPVDVEWSSTGLLFVAEQAGVIRVVDSGAVSTFVDIRGEVNNDSERGLLGIAAHPDFGAGSPYVYALYSYDPSETVGQTGNAGPDGGGQRVSRLTRFTADAATGFTTAVAGSATTILGAGGDWTTVGDPAAAASTTSVWACGNPASVDNCIPADSVNHSIGTVAFGPDGMLYVGNGDGADFAAESRSLRALDLDSLAGKIMRIDPDTGLGLPDNPHWDGDPNSNRSRVWYVGLRNPFRFTFDQAGSVWVGDVGAGQFEEVNSATAGSDFGWPCYEGGGSGTSTQNPDFNGFAACQTYYGSNNAVAPAYAYSHNSGSAAIIAGDFYTGTAWPVEYHDALIVGDYVRSTMTALGLSGGPVTETQLATELLAVSATFGPDGHLYLAGIGGGSVDRIRYAPGEDLQGSLRTTTVPAVPSMISLDGVDRTQWGVDWLSLDSGTYQQCFSDVPGFVTPPCETVGIASGFTAVTQGAFKAKSALQVTTRVAGTAADPVQSAISIDGAAAAEWGHLMQLAPGLHEVCWGPVAGFIPPPCETVTLTTGVGSSVEGVFTTDAGAPGPADPSGFLRVTTTPAVPSTISVDGVDVRQFGLEWVPTAIGSHDVCFSDVPEYETPSCETVTIVAGQTTVVDGPFSQMGTLRVLTDPATDVPVSVGAVPRNQWGLFTSFQPGLHTVCAAFPTGDSCSNATVTAGAETLVSLSPGAGGNQPPTAVAGPDQTVVDTDGSGAELITLDGSASSDPDGGVVFWDWRDGGALVATGVSPTFSLGVGVHTLELTVTDNDTATAVDTIVVTVDAAENSPPVADAGTDRTVVDDNDNGVQFVSLDGSASFDPDGSVASWDWREGGVLIGSGEAPVVSLDIGVHTIDLTVTDDGGATGVDTVVWTVDALPNVAPTADAGPDQTVVDTDGSGAESVVMDGTGSSDSDGSIVSWDWRESGGLIATGAAPSVLLPVGTHTVDLTVTDDEGTSDVDTVIITVEEAADPVVYVSVANGGAVGGVAFAGEDVISYDTGTGSWSMVIDGSDVDLDGEGRDIDAVHRLGDGTFLLSMERGGSVSGVNFDDSDVIRFIPTSLGTATAGTFEMYFDGSDVGLTTNDENVVAIAVLSDGSLLLSTFDQPGVAGVTGATGNDVLRFVPTSLGTSTSGTFEMWLDGSDVGLTNADEEINGVAVGVGDELLFTAVADVAVAGASGGPGDVFACGDATTGTASACTFSLFWNGSGAGLDEVVDAVSLG